MADRSRHALINERLKRERKGWGVKELQEEKAARFAATIIAASLSDNDAVRESFETLVDDVICNDDDLKPPIMAQVDIALACRTTGTLTWWSEFRVVSVFADVVLGAMNAMEWHNDGSVSDAYSELLSLIVIAGETAVIEEWTSEIGERLPEQAWNAHVIKALCEAERLLTNGHS